MSVGPRQTAREGVVPYQQHRGVSEAQDITSTLLYTILCGAVRKGSGPFCRSIVIEEIRKAPASLEFFHAGNGDRSRDGQ
jgi:hypothetical protein